MTDNDFFNGVCECLEDVTEVPQEEIKAGDSIINDLDADSLDLLHLIFSLEQYFKLSIKPREIERRAKANLGDVPLEIDGVYTAEALVELSKSMPEVPKDEFREGMTTGELPRLFRVQTFVNLVKSFSEEQHG